MPGKVVAQIVRISVAIGIAMASICGPISGTHARVDVYRAYSADAINISGLSVNTIRAGEGVVLVISGTGFPAAASTAPEVTIGNAALAVSFWNTVTIQAALPAETLIVAKTYTLRVKVANGSDNDTKDFFVTPAPLDALRVGMDSLSPGNPLTPTVAVNASLVYSVTGQDKYGNRIQNTAVSWLAVSGGTLIASTPFTATLRAGTVAGNFNPAISAITNSVQGFAALDVRPGSPVSLAVSPPFPLIAAGSQQQFTATGTDAFGNSRPLNAVWTANPTAGTVDNSGKFTASGSIGLYSNGVTATVSGLIATTGVNIVGLPPASISLTPASVTSPGIAVAQTVLFTATVKDGAGDLLPGPVTWSSTIGSIASTGPLTALLYAGNRAGAGQISAQQDGVSSNATVVVAPINATQAVATPNTLVANGRAASTIVISARSAVGPVGAGIPVTMTYAATPANTLCIFTPATGVTAGDGTFTTSLKCTRNSLATTPSTVRVSAILGTLPTSANASVDVQSTFVPHRQLLSAVSFFPLITGNHLACQAVPLPIGATGLQRADDKVNIYRFTPTSATVNIELRNYKGTGGFLSAFRLINAAGCPASAEIATVFSVALPAGSPNFSTQLTNLRTDSEYLLAIQTTGSLSSEVYVIRLAP